MSKTKKNKARKSGKAFLSINRLAEMLSGSVPRELLIAAIEAAAAAAIEVLKAAPVVDASAELDRKPKTKKNAVSKKKRKKEKSGSVAPEEVVDSHE